MFSKYLIRFKFVKIEYSLIGDVWGKSLFIGDKIINNNNKMSPDSVEADKIVYARRQSRVLISSEVLNHNVLKIKPPMVFDYQDADYLIESFVAVLNENS